MTAYTASQPIVLAHVDAFALGLLAVRPALREIAGPALRETLEPRVMQVLVALARADGAIVTRDELTMSCWGGRVVGEDAINRTIGRLRRLSVQAEGAFTLETIRKVGYRLTVPETAVARPVQVEPVVAVETAPPAPASPRRWSGSHRLALMALLALAGGQVVTGPTLTVRRETPVEATASVAVGGQTMAGGAVRIVRLPAQLHFQGLLPGLEAKPDRAAGVAGRSPDLEHEGIQPMLDLPVAEDRLPELTGI